MTNQHVLPRGKDWAVKKEGAKRASRVVPLKEQAVRYATQLAQKGPNSSQVVLHRKDGTIQAMKGAGKTTTSQLGSQHRVHVLNAGKGVWAVKSANAQKPAKSFTSKYDAIRFAHAMADRKETAMVVHNEDNTIEHVDIPPHFRSPLSDMLHLR